MSKHKTKGKKEFIMSSMKCEEQFCILNNFVIINPAVVIYVHFVNIEFFYFFFLFFSPKFSFWKMMVSCVKLLQISLTQECDFRLNTKLKSASISAQICTFLHDICSWHTVMIKVAKRSLLVWSFMSFFLVTIEACLDIKCRTNCEVDSLHHSHVHELRFWSF